jgi:transposase InsO family protein
LNLQVNTHWVGDITYIRHHQGWSYLATVLDLGSREIVGYTLSQAPDAQLARQAFIQAVKIQQPKTSHLMFHSDQGVQYMANLTSVEKYDVLSRINQTAVDFFTQAMQMDHFTLRQEALE